MFRIHTVIPRTYGRVSVHLSDEHGNGMELLLNTVDLADAASTAHLGVAGEAYGIADVPKAAVD